tara:strand:+ start:4637 stop:5596 length:960 start_codon:yes stop_codon:yes gene_type:complete
MSILCININQTKELVALGYIDRFEIYILQTGKQMLCKKTDEIRLIHLYYNSNIIGIVGDKNPFNMLNMWDDSKNKYIGLIDNKHEILEFKMNKKYIVCRDEYNLNIYKFDTLSFEYSIIYKNICNFDLSIHMNMVVYSNIEGYIQIYDIDKDNNKNFKAHNNKIQYVKLSNNGLYVASVSENGRKIKVYNSLSGSIVKEFIRGIYMSEIVNIEFDLTCVYLLVYSITGTVHIYDIMSKNTEMSINKISNYLLNYNVVNYEYSLYRLELNKVNKMCVLVNINNIFVLSESKISNYILKTVGNNKKYICCSEYSINNHKDF